MTVGDLMAKLRDYPRDMEVMLARVFDNEVDGKVYELDKVRMKDVALEEGIVPVLANDFHFDMDEDTSTAVVLFPGV